MDAIFVLTPAAGAVAERLNSLMPDRPSREPMVDTKSVPTFKVAVVGARFVTRVKQPAWNKLRMGGSS